VVNEQDSVETSLTKYHECSRAAVQRWQLFIDGASRNNPGLAGVGIFLLRNDEPVYKQGFFVGIKTNNQAEYLALLLGIIILKNYARGNDIVLINSDSELLVKQIKGEYRVKDQELQKLYRVALTLLHAISYDIGHVLREKNKVADALANAGIDQKVRIPESFLAMLNEYAISL
jgi:ribonuclease HI